MLYIVPAGPAAFSTKLSWAVGCTNPTRVEGDGARVQDTKMKSLSPKTPLQMGGTGRCSLLQKAEDVAMFPIVVVHNEKHPATTCA